MKPSLKEWTQLYHILCELPPEARCAIHFSGTAAINRQSTPLEYLVWIENQTGKSETSICKAAEQALRKYIELTS